MVLWLLDIGNTRIKWVCYEQTNNERNSFTLLHSGAEFLENISKLAEGPWAQLKRPDLILGCSVVHQGVRDVVTEQLDSLGIWNTEHMWVVSRAQERGLINGYDHPSRLGPDRWMAMLGARRHLVKQSRFIPAIVVMVGTAVTIDAIEYLAPDSSDTPTWRFIGGIILPGHGTMLKALHSGTAGLHVPTGNVRDFPTNTSDALTSGGTFAIAGAVEKMRTTLASRCGIEPVCIISGGAAWKMLPSMQSPVEQVEHLVFEGLLNLALEQIS
jgi:type III pantothenate kinase